MTSLGTNPDPGRAHVTHLVNLEGDDYTEFLRVPTMSLGVYTLAAGSHDGQNPHAEDEAYLVLEGRARIDLDGDPVDVSPGSVVFVPARMPHHFHDITEDLRVLVFFAPAESAPTDEGSAHG